RVLLNNVKVLAIGTRLGQTGTTGAPADPTDPKSQIFTNTAIATLELSPAQADMLINATSLGKISLVLRSVADFAQTGQNDAGAAPTPDNNQSVKVIKFGRALSVTPGSAQQQGQPEVNTAALVAPVIAGATTPLVTTTGPFVTTTSTAPADTPTVTTTTTTSAPTGPVFTPGGATPMTPPSVN
ncbi:MAG: RcpC/CpaB family pilus assembly protein, partial [Devosia sp.]